MREQLAFFQAPLAGLLVMVVGLAAWDRSTAFWLKIPSWAPILPMACYAGAVIWVTCLVVFSVHRRVVGK